ncbi:MAG TPA: flagellar motor protein MotB [Verrucomicrobiae bacterium]|jgi:chemotaxis protein MotB|nr:flagellar motor protein MotB [Verrucomicrobiae bacterium]
MSHKKGHHGGAWKVAYADFTTAMMALFIVLWLTSQDQRIKDAVERAFRNPFTSVTKDSVGIIPSKDTQAVRSSSGNFDSASAVELTILRRLNQDLLRSFGSAEGESENPIKLDLTPEGMCINVFDRSHKPIFEPQSMKFTPYGEWVFSTLAWEISRYGTFSVELEGHTESGNPPIRADYGDWEISTDRANAVRRSLIEHGVAAQQITKVAGFGDTQPMPESDSTNEINRRVTVLLNLRSTKKA